MKSIKITLIGSLLGVTSILLAQTTLPVPRNIQAAYEKGTRSTVGILGKNYWQNFAAYNIQIRFYPATRLISGTEDITYTNNSPDTLKEIIFKLYPNLYQKGGRRLILIDSSDITSGVQISQFKIDGKSHPSDSLKIYATNMQILIPPLLPKRSLNFNITYSYNLNKGSHIRTGEIDSGAWFLAYFFPRITVYDDIDGWNYNRYLGTQEFYNDFGNFKVGITVPKDYIVWATGDLQNCAEVFTSKYCQRLQEAERSDGVTTIIDSTDLKEGNITVNHPENTFRFEATNVTDFALAISNHYIWKSSSLIVDSTTGRRTRVDAVFNPKHKDFYEVIDFARKTVESMSYKFPRWPFPYPHVTVFNGLSWGMEYPMMVNDISYENRDETIDVTLHEIFHTLFPFYLGINETKYGWMDEGLAQMSNWIIMPMIDSTLKSNLFLYSVKDYQGFAGKEADSPIITLSTQADDDALYQNSYPKPALGYLYIKDMLGDERFYKGLHQYIRDWNGKHPIPFDFFNSMNVGSGVNLNWFWERWFFDRGIPDLAIGKFTDGKKEKTVVIEMKGDKPLPIDLSILFTDGSIQNIHRSTGVWELGNKTVEIKFTSSKKVKEITLGSPIVPDVNKKDNHLVLGI
jgi:hypothetical protein